MNTAPFPVEESARQRALDRYEAVNSDRDSQLDDIAFVASYICQTPISAVTLIDHDRQWIKSAVGMEVGQTARDDAFCAHTILSSEVMVIEDASLDPRFADNPYVTENPHIRFYAGAPLITPDNFKLGSLCVIDREPRSLSSEQRKALQTLSRMIMGQLELRRASNELATALKEVKTLSGLVPICSYCKDIRDDQGYWKRVEEYMSHHTNADFSHGLCPKCRKIHFPDP